jgi:hypothetical protein
MTWACPENVSLAVNVANPRHDADAPAWSGLPMVRDRQSRRRWFAGTLSVAVHALIPLAFLATAPEPDPPAEAEPIIVTLAPPLPPPEPPPAPSEAPTNSSAAATPTPAKTPAKSPPKVKVRPAKAVAEVAPLIATPDPEPPPLPRLGEAQLAGAVTAGSGGGGGGAGAGGSGAGSCDMVRRLQAALRADPDVRAAVARADADAASRGAILVWNGDWLRSPGQSGKGLAGVRQAITMEVAFAPESCRQAPMRGLVLLTLGDGPGSGRLVIGTPQWRWTDLLTRNRG